MAVAKLPRGWVEQPTQDGTRFFKGPEFHSWTVGRDGKSHGSCPNTVHKKLIAYIEATK